jgi:hypothetical protein
MPVSSREQRAHRELRRPAGAGGLLGSGPSGPTVVEELVSARTQEGDDVLEVRGRAGRCAERRGIERSTPQGEEGETRQAAADLEPTRADVLVRDAVAEKVEDRSREERREP